MDKGPWFDEVYAWKLKKQFTILKCLKDGDIVVFHTPGFIPALIRILTIGRANHVGIVINAEEMKFIHVRLSQGVVIMPLYNYMAEDWRIRCWIRRYEGLSEENLKTVIDYAISRVNAPYDTLAIGHLLFRCITTKLPFIRHIFKKMDILQDRVKHFCSELVELSYNKINISFKGNHSSSTVTPQDFFKSKQLQDIEQF